MRRSKKKLLSMVITCCSCCTLIQAQLAEVEGTIKSSASFPEIQLYDAGLNQNRLEGRLYESGNIITLASLRGDLRFRTADNGSPLTRMTIDGSHGNIGIGTEPSSTAKLHIKYDGQAIKLEGDEPWIAWFNNGAFLTKGYLSMNDVNQMVLSNATNADLSFRTNNLDRMTIHGNGSWQSGKDVSTSGFVGNIFLGDSDPDNEANSFHATSDQLVARFKNGYYFMTSGGDPSDGTPRTGVFISNGGNAWSSISDINRKENLEYLDDRKVLEKLATVEYASWNYKSQDPKNFRHYGIMAQEFYELFGCDSYGTIGNDTSVNPIDMLGVTMSALKGASLRIDEQRKEIRAIKRELAVIREEFILNAVKDN